jgi:DNA-directed RNA polymerase specialized sigma24 family protein
MASDAELIGRSLAGDEEAFMEVICRHEVAIGAYLERRAGREAAQDLLGDVWAAAFESRGRMAGRSPRRGRGCTGWR